MTDRNEPLGVCEAYREPHKRMSYCHSWRPVEASAPAAPPADEMMLLRREVWLRHGHEGLYGDDGEMQCGTCGIDFKRLPIPRLVELLSTQDVIRYHKQRAAAPDAELRELRARREEAEWWYSVLGDHVMPCDDSECVYCCRLTAIAAREKELEGK